MFKKLTASIILLIAAQSAQALQTSVVNSKDGQSALISSLNNKLEQLKIELDSKINGVLAAASVSDTAVFNDAKSYTDTEIAKVKTEITALQNRLNLIESCNRQGKLYSTSSNACISISNKPSFITRSAKKSAFRWPSASVSCPSGYVMTGGGGGCSTAVGYNRMPYNGPSGNGWRVSCDTDKHITSTATVHVRCMKQ